MTSTSKKGPIIDAGLCRCCGVKKRCRLLNVEYEWFGQKEIYSDMFVDCFGLLLSHLDGEIEERLICATCVTRLREACCFRLQVLECEEKLLSRIHGENDIAKQNSEVKEEFDVKDEQSLKNEDLDDHSVKNEDLNDHNDSADHIDNDPDDLPLIVYETKRAKKKKMKVNKRRKSIKSENLNIVPKKIVEEIPVIYEDYDLDTTLKDDLKTMEINSKATKNVITLIENSYVCPFDTSFSDFFCMYCREVFTDPVKLREHSLTHDPTTFKNLITSYTKKFQIDLFRIDCRLCSEEIQDIDTFKSHIVNVHDKEFHEVEDRFLKFKLTIGSLTCTECNLSFNFFHALKKHMAEHFGKCICDKCGAHYFEERMLILHQKTHERIEEKFPCKDCGKNFKSKYTRYIHIAKTHKKEAAYQCNKCDEVFFSYTLRYRHKIEIHGEERMFQCEHCNRVYDSRKSLREHNRRYHLKIFKHQCDLCDKRFYLPSRLKEHMSSHTGERNFRCEFCGKSYPRLRGLKVHMQSHNADKKYKCVLCNASFTQNQNLKNHIKRQHVSVKVDYRES